MDDDKHRSRLCAELEQLRRLAGCAECAEASGDRRQEVYVAEHVDEDTGREFWSVNGFDGEGGWQSDETFPSRTAAERAIPPSRAEDGGLGGATAAEAATAEAVMTLPPRPWHKSSAPPAAGSKPAAPRAAEPNGASVDAGSEPDSPPAQEEVAAGPTARPVAFQGDLRNLPEALAPLKKRPNWVCWRWEWKVNKKKTVGKWTKPPLRPDNPQRYAKNNDPSTWGTYEQALAAFEAGNCDGIGFSLLGADIGAQDIDKCRDPATGDIAPEAMGIVHRAASYAEMTPSGTGLRVIGYGTGGKVHRKQKLPDSAVEIESYRGAERYITITGNPLPGTSPHLANIDAVIDAVVTELDGRDDENEQAGNEDAGDASGETPLPPELEELVENGVPPDQDQSAAFHRAVCWLGDCGWSAGRIEEHIAGKPIVPERFAKRLRGEIDRSLRKAKQRKVPEIGRLARLSLFKYEQERRKAAKALGIRVRMLDALVFAAKRAQQSRDHVADDEGQLRSEDFYGYMLEHRYIFIPTGQIWPAESVDARVPPTGSLNASEWLDRNRPVEQMTWAPGEPVVIEDRLIAEGGWMPRSGCRVFNLYRPPIITPVAGNPDRWLRHVDKLYGNDGTHIVYWCAHRVQKPAVKINHALLLGGKQGIGKDTILEPVKRAVGPWNVHEVSPAQVLGRFNGFLKSVILRVSEARDLGEFDRFAFYDHTKAYTAAPPDVLRIDEKHRQEYAIPNVVGIVITTNHKADGIYLPADDRRHYVVWSDLDKADFADEYWDELWDWYENGGCQVVAHYLRNLDISAFNPKAPPPQTPAFWEIVNASRSPEDAELADALDAYCRSYGRYTSAGLPDWPDVVTIADIVAAFPQQSNFGDYLQDRKNSRRIPHRFEACGYTPVRNLDANDGLWRIKGRRQVIYARASLSSIDRLDAAKVRARQ